MYWFPSIYETEGDGTGGGGRRKGEEEHKKGTDAWMELLITESTAVWTE